jgi:glycosyltransferase involved in cell wall biosynthesis
MTNCNVIGCLAGRIAQVPVIYGGIRNAYISHTKIITERIIHNHLSSGSIFNCYSGEREIGGKGFKQHKSFVIPNCFQNIKDPIIRKERDIKHIVTVARYVPQKDYETAIKAIGLLAKKRNDFVFDAIGYGVEESNIRKWIDRYDVKKHVILHIRPDNVQALVGNSDVYLSTSLFEGTSNSIMEALNWSLPVVATNVGDNGCLVHDKESGFVHDKYDAEGITESLNILLDSVDKRNQMGHQGNRILHENYSIELFLKRYLDLIEK